MMFMVSTPSAYNKESIRYFKYFAHNRSKDKCYTITTVGRS